MRTFLQIKKKSSHPGRSLGKTNSRRRFGHCAKVRAMLQFQRSGGGIERTEESGEKNREINSRQIRKEAKHGIQGSAATGIPHADQIALSFGRHEISSIRTHVGGKAETANRRMGSEAYTMGESVAFKNPPSLRQAAHEAAHVVQQRNNIRLFEGIGQKDDKYERQADRVADSVARGDSAEPLLDQNTSTGFQNRDRLQFQNGTNASVPTIASWNVRNSNGTDTESDNCCSYCPRALGIDPNPNEFENAIEFKAVIRNHSSGYTYDIKRTIEKKTWRRSGESDEWDLSSSKAAGTDDDARNSDECLNPQPDGSNHKIYSFDGPGFSPGAPSTSTSFTDYVQIANFNEFVEITKPDNSTTDDSNSQNWHSKLWVKRPSSQGSWSVDSAGSSLGTGHLGNLEP